MARFQRGLAPTALKALSDMADDTEPNWWKDLLTLWSPSGTADSQRPLRLAVRKNSLNYYYKGNNIAQVVFDRNSKPRVEVHEKYAFDTAKGDKSAKLDSSGCIQAVGHQPYEYEGSATFRRWMAQASKIRKDGEKAEVELWVATNSNVIDLEMGLPSLVEGITGPDGKEMRPGKGSGAPRVDMVSLERGDTGPRVVFWEVKLLNDRRLVSDSKKGTPPKVVCQVRAYQNFFKDDGRMQDVRSGYIKTCRVLSRFIDAAERIDRRSRELSCLVKEVIRRPETVSIDPSPRILVCGTGRATSSRPDHLKRLHEEFKITCFECQTPCEFADLPRGT